MLPLCPLCGVQTLDGEMCAYHHYVYGADWAEGNRIMCNFFHRGVVPERVKAEDDAWGYSTDEVSF
jgi:hypothetical protein